MCLVHRPPLGPLTARLAIVTLNPDHPQLVGVVLHDSELDPPHQILVQHNVMLPVRCSCRRLASPSQLVPQQATRLVSPSRCAHGCPPAAAFSSIAKRRSCVLFASHSPKPSHTPSHSVWARGGHGTVKLSTKACPERRPARMLAASCCSAIDWAQHGVGTWHTDHNTTETLLRLSSIESIQYRARAQKSYNVHCHGDQQCQMVSTMHGAIALVLSVLTGVYLELSPAKEGMPSKLCLAKGLYCLGSGIERRNSSQTSPALVDG